MNSIEHLPGSEREHFMQCPTCSNWFDMRDLNDVLRHEHQAASIPHFMVLPGVKVPKEPSPFYKTLKPLTLN